MKISIIIVNYNVKFFLEQCLCSVYNALHNINAEVYVVDNNSVDGSCSMVKEKFPNVKLIENKQNVGFSKANNQAINLSSGEYVLLLNPDTVVEENTFSKILGFMDSHPDAGGLGVKMIDGKGNFLPESKRALPTPKVAFNKVFGLSALFPKSKMFGKYHLGYLDKSKINEVEVLSGAFMLLRKEALKKSGLLDETFFMYGEDIDLSYRILKAGYKNYYFPDTTIIHYKGESTKKSSINYVIVFYKAMIIFAKKHFTAKNANTFALLINLAIYFRASLAIFSRMIKSILIPLFDFALMYSVFYIVKIVWEHYKFPDGSSYPQEFMTLAVPIYIAILLISIFFNGGYDKPISFWRILRGFAAGFAILLILYALVNEEFRFSRVMILLGVASSLLSVILLRYFIKLLNISNLQFEGSRKKIIIVGNQQESERISTILKKSDLSPVILGFVSPVVCELKNNFIGNLDQIKEIIKIHKINEIIFCAKDIPSQIIIKNMLELSELNVDYKIASQDGFSVIGSNSINTSGELYSFSLNTISKSSNRRNKRVIDILMSLIFVALSPVFILLVKKKLEFIKNIFLVFLGFKTWVGYLNSSISIDLPKIKKAVVFPLKMNELELNQPEFVDKINLMYAKDYNILYDIGFIFKNIRYLGNNF